VGSREWGIEEDLTQRRRARRDKKVTQKGDRHLAIPLFFFIKMGIV